MYPLFQDPLDLAMQVLMVLDESLQNLLATACDFSVNEASITLYLHS